MAGLAPLLSFAHELSAVDPQNIEYLTMPNSLYPADHNRLIPKEPGATTWWNQVRADQIPPPQTVS
jgi:hypothetical protein